MNTNLSSLAASQVETDCLVAVVLDQGEKDKPSPVVASEAPLGNAAKDVIASGEVTGKMFETTLLHRPAGLKAKRLLLVGGGKAKNFSATELRKLAGAAVRTLKGKNVRSFAFAIPENGVAAADAVRAIVEGVYRRRFRSRLLQERPQGSEDRCGDHRGTRRSSPHWSRH